MNKLRSIAERIIELMADEDQSDEATLIELVITSQHYKYFLGDQKDYVVEWENLLRDGKEVGYLLNNEKALIIFITEKAMASV